MRSDFSLNSSTFITATSCTATKTIEQSIKMYSKYLVVKMMAPHAIEGMESKETLRNSWKRYKKLEMQEEKEKTQQKQHCYNI